MIIFFFNTLSHTCCISLQSAQAAATNPAHVPGLVDPAQGPRLAHSSSEDPSPAIEKQRPRKSGKHDQAGRWTWHPGIGEYKNSCISSEIQSTLFTLIINCGVDF